MKTALATLVTFFVFAASLIYAEEAEDLSFSDAPTVVVKGLGFRYLIAEKFGLRMGIDVAMSNEDKAFYIQFGTAWLGL